mmetsp:Transcript_65262/g.155860  ORF Transcript_65262/g.155860 Transcript_65262/m.155860 type:complete len:295 (-) Transcript_65262:556-1440(-)
MPLSVPAISPCVMREKPSLRTSSRVRCAHDLTRQRRYAAWLDVGPRLTIWPMKREGTTMEHTHMTRIKMSTATYVDTRLWTACRAVTLWMMSASTSGSNSRSSSGALSVSSFAPTPSRDRCIGNPCGSSTEASMLTRRFIFCDPCADESCIEGSSSWATSASVPAPVGRSTEPAPKRPPDTVTLESAPDWDEDCFVASGDPSASDLSPSPRSSLCPLPLEPLSANPIELRRRAPPTSASRPRFSGDALLPPPPRLFIVVSTSSFLSSRICRGDPVDIIAATISSVRCEAYSSVR